MASNKKNKTLDDLFEDTLKDIFYAENKILQGAAENGQGRTFR